MDVADFSRFTRFGDSCAAIDETGAVISYNDLAALCRTFVDKLGGERKLILLEAANDLGSVVAYLAATTAGHCVILAGEDPGDGHRRIVEAFEPQIICTRGVIRPVAGARPVDLHADVSVLLPTSGSTGSAKLVRLSKENLASNAAAIAEYLGIDSTERAITSLPFHYSYGLSVINSHLSVGASILLTDLSVTHPDFWRLFREHGATSIAGVPYSYELFERVGLRQDPPPSLRTMTQAGGKLSPELVKTYAGFATAHGARFYTMYGQTEASPRMAYLPPDAAAQNPDCIGVPIPGGSFYLIDESGATVTTPDTTGELVYRGPNVMMGYAFARDDLARGHEVEELRTGDLAIRTRRGLYKIVGRASRFVKIAGLRIGLDDVETLLADAGRKAVAAGADGRVAVCILDGGDPQAARDLVARRCGLPASAVIAFGEHEEPRLASGKVNYQAILAKAELLAAEESAAADKNGVITAAYAKALGVAPPGPNATFAGLGGDSLSYVNASMGIERALGHLPTGWETMTISTLEAMVPEVAAKPRLWSWIDSEMLVRISALGLVAIGHAAPAQTEWLRGGSNVLFALAGYNLARFQRELLLSGQVRAPLLGALYRVVLPYFAVMALLLPVSEADRSIGWPLLLSTFTVEFRGPLFAYWFIESVIHALVITCGLFLIPAFRRFASARPFAAALTCVAGAVTLKYAIPFVWNDGRDIHLTVDGWLYIYFIGWAAFLAGSLWRKLFVLALAVVLTTVDFGFPSSRAFWLGIGLAVVLFAPRLPLPTVLTSVVVPLAGASYFIYLMHPIAVHFIVLTGRFSASPWFNIPAVLLASALLGLSYATAWSYIAPRALALVSRFSSWRHGAPPDHRPVD